MSVLLLWACLLVPIVAWTAYREGFSEKNLPAKCSAYKYHVKPKAITRDHKYRLWPGLANQADLVDGEVLFGFEEAMDAIWNNQHPEDCSQAKFLLATQFGQGFGAEMHVLGQALAVAVETGRVLIQSDGDPRAWRLRNSFCSAQNNSHNLECFYEPWTHCTREDAIRSAALESKYYNRKHRAKLLVATTNWSDHEDNLLFNLTLHSGATGAWHLIAENMPQKTSVQCRNRWNEIGSKKLRGYKMPDTGGISRYMDAEDMFRHKQRGDVKDFEHPEFGIVTIPVMNDGKLLIKDNWKLKYTGKEGNDKKVMVVDTDVCVGKQKYIPSMFKDLLSCSAIGPDVYYFWWRAVAATYYIRPNRAALDVIESFDDPMITASKGNCVSTYVRHGDKGGEMKLVPFHFYAKTAETMWNTPGVVTGIYEVKPVSEEATKGKSFKEHIEPAVTVGEVPSDGYDRRIFYIGTETKAVLNDAISWGRRNNIAVRFSNTTRDIVLGFSKRDSKSGAHDHEYISYLVNLRGSLMCSATVCTYPSNYCRVIDELRATVGGKANRYFADVSVETCKQKGGPPCIKRDGNVTLTPMVW